MAKDYCVVLGDVVESRDVADRAAFQRDLRHALEEVNERHDEAVVAPFSLLKGIDEIGGVLATVAPIVEIQRTLSWAVHPTQIRLAAVVGELDVNVETRDIALMDGPAFARADRVLQAVETEELTFRLEGDDPTLDRLVSDELNLLDMLRNDWSERRLEVITVYERHGTLKEAAAVLDISPQAVSKHVRGARLAQLTAIEDRLIKTLRSYPTDDVSGDDSARTDR
ncbi:SatD family protein [Haloarchaeobius sp. TZWWS8]|uniref:SatD family protein n=1 Tax=Haloarchaeobius sp. TZWWS8 TaxID=3446121 RepID=UPI003EB95107